MKTFEFSKVISKIQSNIVEQLQTFSQRFEIAMYHIRKYFIWWKGIPLVESQSRSIKVSSLNLFQNLHCKLIDPHVPQTLKQPPEFLGPNALEFLTSSLCESSFQKECIRVDLVRNDSSMNSQNDP